MFKAFLMTAMFAVLFSPFCLADDDDTTTVEKATYTTTTAAPAAQPVVVSDDSAVEASVTVDASYLDAPNRYNFTKPAVAFRLQQEPACSCECECK